MVDHPKHKASQLLITQEITKHLELVTHLLNNSRQALIITGPNGVGKSTFITILQERTTDSLRYCVIQGDKSLNLDKIQEHLLSITKQHRNKKTVLIIDDAGHLDAGLIDELVDYTLRNPALRILFVLTHDELDFKVNFDKGIDDYYLIEIPPFTIEQWGRYLYLVSSQARSLLALNDITDDLIDATFLETQGIPGKMMTELPAIKSKEHAYSLKLLIAAVIGLIILALLTQWLSQNRMELLESPPTSTQSATPETPKE
ncbi:MAG: ATP-binding protein [Methylococcales bacterium]